jgi:hypothetical protein
MMAAPSTSPSSERENRPGVSTVATEHGGDRLNITPKFHEREFQPARGMALMAWSRNELRADLQHLRPCCRGVEQAHCYAFKAVISVIVPGFVVAVWLGIKATLGK